MDGSFFWDMVALEVERQQTSFEWLYRKTKVAKGTFSSWKSRKMYPRADIAYKIAEALGVSVEYLLTGRQQLKQSSNTTIYAAVIDEIAQNLVFFDSFDLETVKALASSMAKRYNRKPGLHTNLHGESPL